MMNQDETGAAREVRAQERVGEMAVYFSGEKSLTREVPENILSDVRSGFTRIEVSYLPDGSVTVKVPKREMEISKRLRRAIQRLIQEIAEENGALAWKLARRYRV